MTAVARCVAVLALGGLGVVGCKERLPQTASSGEAGVKHGPAVGGSPMAAAGSEDEKGGAAERGAAPPAVVVELFTSEGCSSCPPADAILRRIATDMAGRGVVALSFHVDYWNGLGWPDPFSAPAYTTRQEAYARALGGSGLYTPEMVVGGRDAFVGSDQSHALASIEKALARPPAASITLEASVEAGRTVAASYVVRGAGTGALLHVAIAERGIVSHVARGENAGRTLQHENVVRAFQTLRLPSTLRGRVRIELPASADLRRSMLAAFVQEPSSMEILGAAREELAPGE